MIQVQCSVLPAGWRAVRNVGLDSVLGVESLLGFDVPGTVWFRIWGFRVLRIRGFSVEGVCKDSATTPVCATCDGAIPVDTIM